MAGDKPLAGTRVLELGQLIAGPFAGNVLAYFGAEVIKVEAPGKGDPLRNRRVTRDGTSLWWRSIARNRKCITLDLRAPAYNVADMFEDPHFRARGLFERVTVDGQALELPAIVPKLGTTPGAAEWPGPAVGAHNDEICSTLLGLDDPHIATLRGQGVI